MTTKGRTTCPRICASALTATQLSIPVQDGKPAARHLAGHLPVRTSPRHARARDRAAPDGRMSLESVRAWLARARPRSPADRGRGEHGNGRHRRQGARRRAGADREDAGGPRRRASFLLVHARRRPARQPQVQGRVRRAAADARGRRDPRVDRPSGRRGLPIRAEDAAPGLSRPIAAGVRHRLSRRRIAQHVGGDRRPSGCSRWSASAGSTYAGCRTKRPGFSSSAETSGSGQGVPSDQRRRRSPPWRARSAGRTRPARPARRTLRRRARSRQRDGDRA